MSEVAMIDYPLSQLADEPLTGLFASTRLWHPHAAALAVCVGMACQQEGLRRQANRDGEPHQDAYDGIAIDFGLWSDKDVADALLLTSTLSQRAQGPMLGEIADALHNTLVNVAVARLCKTNPEHN